MKTRVGLGTVKVTPGERRSALLEHVHLVRVSSCTLAFSLDVKAVRRTRQSPVSAVCLFFSPRGAFEPAQTYANAKWQSQFHTLLPRAIAASTAATHFKRIHITQ